MAPPRDASATRARILDAAVQEFSAYGLSGARIDGIAAAADANKRAIYEHFGSKEQLFTATVDRVLATMSEAVPLTEDDLPGYAGRLFDYLVAHPHALRLSQWRILERPEAGPDDSGMYATKIEKMGAGAGSIGPTDLIVLVCGLATAWLTTPEDLLAAGGADHTSPARLRAHHDAVVEAARRVVSG
jgi:AcrR family transcriptional regulator